MKTTSLLLVALAAIFTLAPTSEALCVNQAVYNECKSRGDGQLGACASDDWICKCDANKALQDCFLQCQDDTNKVNEGNAHKSVVQTACSLASSQSAAKATATPMTSLTAPTPQLTTYATSQSAKPTVAKTAGTATSPTDKSAANGNKMSVMIAVPLVAAAIMNL